MVEVCPPEVASDVSVHRRAFLGLLAASGPLASRVWAQPASLFGASDARQLGATGDGRTLDTPAVNRAIAAAAAAGGDTVDFPAGTYACHSIRLQSLVALYLQPGATILATPAGGYDAAESNAPWENYQDFGHNHWHNGLIWGRYLRARSDLGPRAEPG
jgi:polygalacturonase